MMVRLMGWEIR